MKTFQQVRRKLLTDNGRTNGRRTTAKRYAFRHGDKTQKSHPQSAV